jgi:hypothetical protein
MSGSIPGFSKSQRFVFASGEFFMSKPQTVPIRAASLLTVIALVSLCSTTHAALVEYLGLHGNGTASVGSNGTLISGVGGSGPQPTTDQYGNPGGALSFVSSDKDYVSVGNGANGNAAGGLDGLTQGTIAFWVKWSGSQQAPTFGPAYGDVLGRQANSSWSNDVMGLSAASPGTGHVSFNLAGYSSNDLTSGTFVPGDGAWHFLALTFVNGGAENLYADGTLVASGTAGTPVSGSAIPLTIGAWIGDGNNYSTSSIDGFRIYNTALTAAQVQALPEPASFILCGLAAIGLFVAARRRRNGCATLAVK